MEHKTNLKKGIIFAFLTALISGVSIFYSKQSVAKIDPLILATSRNIYVGLLFIATVLFTQKWEKIRSLSKKELILLCLIGLIGGGIPFYLFFSGVKLVGAQNANIIHKSLFIWVIAMGSIFLKEKINPGYLIGGALIFVGTYFFMPVKLLFGRGEQLILIATLMWAVENILAKKVLTKATSELVGMFRMGVGGILLLAITFLSGKGALLAGLSGAQLQTIFIGGSILFFYVFTWYSALQHAPAGLVTAILTLSLVVGNILNGAFGRITLGSNDLYSMLCIIAGVSVIAGIKYIPLLVRRYG